LCLLWRSGHERIFISCATRCNSIIRKEFFKPLFDYLPAA
jgi:hypothetical protein